MLEVAAAIIENKDGKLLIARRKKGKSQEGLWEFPGGKLEPGESVEACLRRELAEEMGIEIEPYEAFGSNDHRYGDTLIRLWACKAKYRTGEIVLTDHDDYRWVWAEELESFPFAPADLKFIERLTKGKH